MARLRARRARAIARAAGGAAGATAALRAAAACDPSDAAALTNLGSHLITAGDAAGAADALREAVARSGPARPKEYADASFNLGIALRRAGDGAGAARAYQATLSVQPTHADAHLNLGVALQASRPDVAVRAFEAAIALGHAQSAQIRAAIGRRSSSSGSSSSSMVAPKTNSNAPVGGLWGCCAFARTRKRAPR